MKKAVLSLSGGMDSSSLLLHLLANGYEVTALGFDYGQKHKVELERATALVQYINLVFLHQHGLDAVQDGEYKDSMLKTLSPIKHQIIKLDGLSELLNSSLVEGGQDVPEGHYEQDNMKETVVPNRNKIFSSLIQAVALSVATKNIGDDCAVGEPVAIAMGIHAGDHAIYPDCRQEFRDVDFEAFKAGNWDAELVYHYTPYLEVNKFDILEDGQRSCDILGLDFNEVYRRTNTSYKPIKHYYRHETNAFKWYSDYKSAASVERIEAFIKLGRPDPVEYADENGPTTWEVAKAHVEKVLAEHNS
jgi:7-cyano-7-deazaguanine synthase